MAILDINDIMGNEDFATTATVNGVANVTVIPAVISAEMQISQMGEDVAYELSLKVAVSVSAARDQLVIFRGRTYRIGEIETDSANLSKRLFLKARFGGSA